MLPSNYCPGESRPYINLEYDWLSHRNNYSEELLNNLDWINKQKLCFNDTSNDEAIPIVLPEQLNCQQKLAYDIVNESINITQSQLLMLIIGTAGTGKSFTINALSRLLKKKLKRAAPTGKAAYLIVGETIHQLLKIKVNQYHKPLINRELIDLQQSLKDIKCIIIDEYSMVSQVMLHLIDYRLREATGKSDLYFGGISIILTGDPGQLLPVLGTPLYAPLDSNSLPKGIL